MGVRHESLKSERLGTCLGEVILDKDGLVINEDKLSGPVTDLLIKSVGFVDAGLFEHRKKDEEPKAPAPPAQLEGHATPTGPIKMGGGSEVTADLTTEEHGEVVEEVEEPVEEDPIVETPRPQHTRRRRRR